MSKETRMAIAGILVLAAVGVGTATVVRGFFVAPSESESGTAIRGAPRQDATSSTDAPAHIPGAPERLYIPAIDVDARIDAVGVAKSGHMAVPNSYADVGWYRSGPKPGEEGSAVIDGHVDNGFGFKAVFARLHELKPGDSVSVLMQDGRTVHFAVEKVESYATDEVPLADVFYADGGARLNLITCDGQWNDDARMYDRRVVVYAKLAP